MKLTTIQIPTALRERLDELATANHRSRVGQIEYMLDQAAFNDRVLKALSTPGAHAIPLDELPHRVRTKRRDYHEPVVVPLDGKPK